MAAHLCCPPREKKDLSVIDTMGRRVANQSVIFLIIEKKSTGPLNPFTPEPLHL
jgi:hypothetical protein